jgi:hypothetical protein
MMSMIDNAFFKVYITYDKKDLKLDTHLRVTLGSSF